MLKVKEVFQNTVRFQPENRLGNSSMQIKKVYSLRDCMINPDYIVAVYPHEFSSSLDLDMLEGLDTKGQSYCRVVLDGNSFRSSEIIINRSFEQMEQAFFQ